MQRNSNTLYMFSIDSDRHEEIIYQEHFLHRIHITTRNAIYSLSWAYNFLLFIHVRNVMLRLLEKASCVQHNKTTASILVSMEDLG